MILSRALFATFFAATSVAGCGGGFEPAVAPAEGLIARLAGEDVRAGCGPGARYRLRLIGRPSLDTGLAMIDVTALRRATGERPQGAFAELQAIVGKSPQTVEITSQNETRIGAQQLRDLQAMIDRGELGGPIATGLALTGDTAFWVAISCRNGRFRTDGWKAPEKPSADWDAFNRGLSEMRLLQRHGGGDAALSLTIWPGRIEVGSNRPSGG